MRRRHGTTRARLGGALLAALGALALLALPGVAAAKDSNNDRIPDRWEKRHDLSLKVKQHARDQDRDGLRNRAEFLSDNDPRDRDSDDDGTKDGDENAGTIASFDAQTGRLTITLYGGDTVSGIVTDETRIRCGDDCGRHGDDSSASASHGDDDSGSDSSGPGHSGDDDSPGDDDASGEDRHGEHGPIPPPGAEQGKGHDPDHHGRGHADGNGSECTTAALVVGAVVDEAELRLDDGVATFDEIELEDEKDDSTPTS